MLTANCPPSEIWNLIFSERYGVETIVPSLRPVAAWLSLDHPNIQDEIIRREPLTLLRYGDPGSLSLDARKRLLHVYAAKHAAAEISDDSLDHRALSMFADQGLGTAIRQAWNINSRLEFRLALLRLIHEGAIKECADLARGIVVDQTADDYQRVVAVQALKACDDEKGLRLAAKVLVAPKNNVSAGLAPAFATALYPEHLSSEALLKLIARTDPPRRSTIEGFAHHISTLYDAAPDAAARTKLLRGLATLCLEPPFIADYQRISKRHYELAKNLYEIGLREVKTLGTNQPSVHLVRMLMAIERSNQHDSKLDDGDEKLHELVHANSRLNRALFWADVEEQRANAKNDDRKVVDYWQVYIGGGHALWVIVEDDLSWLFDDLVGKSNEDDRRIALSAIVSILLRAKRLEPEIESLQRIVASSTVLREDLVGLLTPPKEDKAMQRHREFMHKHDEQRKRQEEDDKKSWLQFEQELRAKPDLLKNEACLTSWSSGIVRHYHLTEWLHARTSADHQHAGREWRLLEEGFGREVAEAYRDGMVALWRHVSPERPKKTPDGAANVKWLTLLALAGINIESTENRNWVNQLRPEDAKKAAQHGCYSEQGYPEWIDELIGFHTAPVIPILRRQLTSEWTATALHQTAFLYRYSSPACSIQQPVQKALFQMIVKGEAGDVARLDRALGIIRNLQMDETQKLELIRVARLRLRQHKSRKREDYALRYLAMLFLLEPDHAVDDLTIWLRDAKGKDQKIRAEKTFGTLFDRHHPLIPGALDHASVATLNKLMTTVYQHICPEDDAVHEGSYSPDARDNAENARNTILSALLDRQGADAFRAMQRAAELPMFALRANRFRELARGKAERDAELVPWTASEVLHFERQHTAPIKTGDDLLRLTIAILDDIIFHLTKADATSRPLLKCAKDEDEVQNWLTEQMKFRSRGRFHTYREPEVAGGDKPDIVVASTSAPCEVAVEVKHGGMGWTARQLDHALRSQLAVDYLKPATRRHGILVITNHGNRQWLHPKTNKLVAFKPLIDWLSETAATLIHNGCGAIDVRCVGINALPVGIDAEHEQRTMPPTKKKSVKRRTSGYQRETDAKATSPRKGGRIRRTR